MLTRIVRTSLPSSVSNSITNSVLIINLEDKNENGKDYQPKSHKNSISSEYSTRIRELKLMKIKILIYPWITNFIWLLLLIYRILDVIVIINIDYNNEEEKDIEENEFFEDNINFRKFYQIFLVLHTILSSIRGIIYSLIFIIFEEKVFWNCFKRFINCLCCCCNLKYLENIESDENKLIRNSCTSLTDRNTGYSANEFVNNENNSEK